MTDRQGDDWHGDDWQRRIDALWKRLDELPADAFVAAIDALATERPADDPAALFERAAARDSTGDETGAEALYRGALASGRLDPYRRVRTRIQLGSRLRLLGRFDESERLLREEYEARSADAPGVLRDEVRAVLALTLVAQGRAIEATGLALCALAPHLTRYQRSILANATEILERCSTPG